MANEIESGVASYLIGKTTISVGFPIDHNGRWHVACKYCRFFIGKHCVATDEIPPFPETHIGYDCPLKFEIKEEN